MKLKAAIITIITLLTSNMLFSNTLSLDDNGNGTWNVNYSSDGDMAGFQFDVDGATLNDASGGAAGSAGFLVSSSETTALGFSLSGATIPSGEGVLIVLDVTGTPSGLSSIIISDPSGSDMGFTYDDGSTTGGGTTGGDGWDGDACTMPDYSLHVASDGSVLYNSSSGIAGFQFDVDGASVLDASGGDAEAAGFLISSSATTVLGFSLSGATFSGCGSMINLDLDGDASGLSGIIISDSAGSALPFEYFDGSGGGDPTYASVQVIHNSASPTVDVYVDGALAVEDFEYRTATPILELSTSFTVGIAPANGDVIAEFPFELMEGGEYVVVATGLLGDDATPFDLAAAGTTFGASGGNVGLDVYHGSTDAPPVDVYANGGLLLGGLGYGEFSGYTEVPADDYVVGIAPEGGDVIAEFEAPLSGLGGGSAVVFASGFLSGDDPAFGLFAALGDGTVLELPAYVAPEPDVMIMAGNATVSDGMAYVSMSYHSSVDVAGVQFTISDDPDIAVAVDYSTDNGDFTASANDSEGDVTTVYFSLTGAVLPATDEYVEFATLTYELTSELGDGDVVALHFLDVVCASAAGTALETVGVDGSISLEEDGMTGDVNGDGGVNVQDIIVIINWILDGDYSSAGDINGDGGLNVQDIILIVNMIIDGRSADATRAEFQRLPSQFNMESDGFIGAVQMTLAHGPNFSIDLTNDAMAADYKTSGNHTRLVIVAPSSENLFTYSGDFQIVDHMVVNGSDEIPVVTPAVFELGAAYPNPFNPTTNITLDVMDAGYVSIKVYNVLGQVSSVLSEGYMQPGNYALTWDASEEVSGMYLVRAETAGHVSTQKLLLIK